MPFTRRLRFRTHQVCDLDLGLSVGGTDVDLSHGGRWTLKSNACVKYEADVLCPLTTTPDKYKYVLLVVDAFTSWCEAFPLVSQEAIWDCECIVLRNIHKIWLSPYTGFRPGQERYVPACFGSMWVISGDKTQNIELPPANKFNCGTGQQFLVAGTTHVLWQRTHKLAQTTSWYHDGIPNAVSATTD